MSKTDRSPKPGGCVALFLDNLPETLRGYQPSNALGPLLEGILASVRSSWPQLDLALEHFVAALARRIPADADPEAHLPTLRHEDLYLAYACGQGDPAALEAFDSTCLREAKNALLEAKAPIHLAEEIQQQLRERFFVGNADRPAAIASYAGRGSLRSWVRISALREFYRSAKSDRRWRELEERQLSWRSPKNDPELDFLKERYRGEFSQAFKAALADISSRQRNMLRHFYLDGMTIEQIGFLYRVHRATAARWLDKARQAVSSKTRQILIDELKLISGEYESLMRMIGSQLDASIRSNLGPDDGSVEP